MSAVLPPTNGQAPCSAWRRLRHTPWRDLLRGRGATGRLDWERTLAACGLPEAVRAVVAQVVRQSRLWRLEKAQVCDELIAHFADGLAEGETAEALLKHFGDAKQTALLIRRAKKRQRPLLWHGLKWTLRAVAAAMVLYAGLAAWYATDKVVISRDYLAEMNAPALAAPESERAWPVYRDTVMGWPALWAEPERDGDAGRPLNFSAAVQDAARAAEPGRTNPGTPARDMVARELGAHQREIAVLRAAAARPHFGFMGGLGFRPEDRAFFRRADDAAPPAAAGPGAVLTPEEAQRGALFNVIMPHLSCAKSQLACVLAADMRLAADRGDAPAVLADAQALLGLARQLRDSPVLIEQLVGCAIHRMAVVQGAAALDRPGLFDADGMREAAALLGRFPVRPFDLGGEKMAVRDAIQRVYTDDGGGNGRFAGPWLVFQAVPAADAQPPRRTLAGCAIQPVVTLLAAPRREAAERADAQLDRLQAELCAPLWKTAGEHQAPARSLWQSLRFPLAECCLPDIGPALRRSLARAQADHAALELGIALHRHKLAAGGFPKDLSALVPAYLSELPADPITGGPLHYRVDEQGNPVVYSVGGDRQDDGGHAPVNKAGEDDTDATQRWENCQVKGDWILWPMQGRPLMKKAK